MDTARSEHVHCSLAKPRDAQRLAKMSRDLIERGHGWSWQAPRIARSIRAQDSVVLCAYSSLTSMSLEPTKESGVRLMGFAIMEFNERHAHLNLLAVSPEFRRKGIARMLLEWLEKSAMVAGIEQISLEVRAQNGSGRRFYARLGYEEVEQIPRYYSGRETAYRLRKQLRAPFTETPASG